MPGGEASSRLKVLIDFIVQNLEDVTTAGSAIREITKGAKSAGIEFTRSGNAIKKGTSGFISSSEAATQAINENILNSLAAQEALRAEAKKVGITMKDTGIGVKEGVEGIYTFPEVLKEIVKQIPAIKSSSEVFKTMMSNLGLSTGQLRDRMDYLGLELKDNGTWFNRLTGEEKSAADVSQMLGSRFLETARALKSTSGLRTAPIETFKEALDNVRVSSDQLGERMRLAHLQLREGGVWWDQIRNREISAKEATQILQRTFRRFRMELLSVMFFGMNIGKMFESWLQPAMEAFGIFDMWNSMLLVTFMPAMEELSPILYDIMDWFMGLPEPVQKAIGWLAISGMVAGKVLGAFGTLGLGINGLIQTFPIIMKLGTLLGIAGKTSVTALDAVENSIVGIGPTTIGTVGLSATALISLAAIAAAAAIIIYEAWKSAGHAISLSQKMELDKSKGDWDSYRTHALMRSIEMRTIVPKTIMNMLHDVGGVILQIGEMVVQGVWSLFSGAVSGVYWFGQQIVGALAGIPGLGELFKPALASLQQTQADWESTSAQAATGISKWFTGRFTAMEQQYGDIMGGMAKDTIKSMVEMGIPLKEIISEYGTGQEAMAAFSEEIYAGRISENQLQQAIMDNKKALEQTSPQLQDMAFNAYNLGNATNTLSQDLQNNIDNWNLTQAALKDTGDSLTSLEGYVGDTGTAFNNAGLKVDDYIQKLQGLQSSITGAPTAVSIAETDWSPIKEAARYYVQALNKIPSASEILDFLSIEKNSENLRLAGQAIAETTNYAVSEAEAVAGECRASFDTLSSASSSTASTMKTTMSDSTNSMKNSFTGFTSSVNTGWLNISNAAQTTSSNAQSSFATSTASMGTKMNTLVSDIQNGTSSMTTNYAVTMDNMVTYTKKAVSRINAELDKIKTSILTTHTIITYYYEVSIKSGKGQSIWYGQEGGIVTRPTLGVIGEAGPEAVIPLHKLKDKGMQINYNPTINISAEINQEVDIDRVMSRVDNYIVGKLKSMVS